MTCEMKLKKKGKGLENLGIENGGLFNNDIRVPNYLNRYSHTQKYRLRVFTLYRPIGLEDYIGLLIDLLSTSSLHLLSKPTKNISLDILSYDHNK